MHENLETKISQLIQDKLVTQNCELFGVHVYRAGRRQVVSLAIDHPEGGITLEECAHWNQMVGNLIEGESLIEESYVVEVASPGLDHPLREERDYRRLIGKRLWLQYRTEEKPREIVARLVEVQGGVLRFEAPAKPDTLEISSVVQAKPSILLKSESRAS